MKSKVLLFTTLILLLGIVTALYFLFDLSNQNKELGDQLQQLNHQLTETEEQLVQTENEVTSLADEKSQLSKQVNDLTDSNKKIQSSFDELQTSFDELYQFTYCGNEFVQLNMVYRSNTKANEALNQWVDEMWGGVQDSNWSYFWSEDEPTLHVVETGYANDYFVVYFKQQNFFDSPNGVFLVSHHCWLDISD